jgi:hypothetical protein
VFPGAALAAALLAAGCAGGNTFTASEPFGLVVLELGNQYAAQSTLSVTIVGYDDTFETLVNQSPSSGQGRISTSSASELGPYYVFGAVPGTYVIRDVSRSGGDNGRCFADGSIAFDVRAGTAVFIGAATDSSASATRAALSTYDYRFATLALSDGNAGAADAALAEVIKSKVPLTRGGDPRPVTFDLRRTSADAVGNTCRRAQG